MGSREGKGVHRGEKNWVCFQDLPRNWVMDEREAPTGVLLQRWDGSCGLDL